MPRGGFLTSRSDDGVEAAVACGMREGQLGMRLQGCDGAISPSAISAALRAQTVWVGVVAHLESLDIEAWEANCTHLAVLQTQWPQQSRQRPKHRLRRVCAMQPIFCTCLMRTAQAVRMLRRRLPKKLPSLAPSLTRSARSAPRSPSTDLKLFDFPVTPSTLASPFIIHRVWTSSGQ